MSTPVILDANSLIARCVMATALDDLKAGGVLTGGVYGTLGLLKAFINLSELFAGPIYAFFDNSVPEFRLHCIPYYKEKRKEKKTLLTDEEKEQAFTQLHLCRLMFETLGVVCAAYRDREADDTVAAAVRVLVEQGHKPVVWSGDHDLLQCVRMGARVFTGSRWIDEDNFEEEMGVPTEVYVLYKALIGDNSDSIPGVYGCGKKRAAAMLQENLEELVDLSPAEQCLVIRDVLKQQKKLRKFEQNFLDDEERIRDVIRGIDLSKSFGGTNGLTEKMTLRPKVDKMAFLRFCKKLAFKSVLGSPEQYVRPFKQAEGRRTC